LKGLFILRDRPTGSEVVDREFLKSGAAKERTVSANRLRHLRDEPLHGSTTFQLFPSPSAIEGVDSARSASPRLDDGALIRFFGRWAVSLSRDAAPFRVDRSPATHAEVHGPSSVCKRTAQICSFSFSLARRGGRLRCGFHFQPARGAAACPSIGRSPGRTRAPSLPLRGVRHRGTKGSHADPRVPSRRRVRFSLRSCGLTGPSAPRY
jgi:hypothetical protein